VCIDNPRELCSDSGYSSLQIHVWSLVFFSTTVALWVFQNSLVEAYDVLSKSFDDHVARLDKRRSDGFIREASVSRRQAFLKTVKEFHTVVFGSGISFFIYCTACPTHLNHIMAFRPQVQFNLFCNPLTVSCLELVIWDNWTKLGAMSSTYWQEDFLLLLVMIEPPDKLYFVRCC